MFPRRLLPFLILLLTAADVFGATRFGNLFAPEDYAEYQLSVEPGESASPRVLSQNIDGTWKVAGDQARVWSVTGNASNMNLSEPVPIPRSAVVFPESLGSVEAGFAYLNRTGGRRQWGSKFSVGSASDHIFHSLAETEVQLTAGWMLPSRKQNAWVLLLNYSNNRTFLNNIPVPAVTYFWNQPERGLQILLGFPLLTVDYQPDKNWAVRASLIGPINQGAEISRRITGEIKAYAAYLRNPQQWLRAGRDNNDNRLIYDEKKALLGFRSPLGKRLNLDLSGGRTFDRRMFEARDATHTGAPRANLSNGWIANLQLTYRWN